MKLKNYIDFLYAMSEREFKTRYKRAIFGFLWVIINPLLEMIIIGTIFSYFINIPNYYLFIFSGLLPWQFFSLSISKATPSFDHQRHLLKKAVFPREAIPLSIIFANFINFLMSLSLLILFLLVFDMGPQNIGLIIIGVIWLLFIIIGISLLTASINTRYRDVNFFTQTALVLIFYGTPILYSSTQLPEKIQKLLVLNPLTTPIEMMRQGLTGQNSNPAFLIPNFIITMLIMFMGIRTFNKMKNFMVDWL